MRAKATLGVLFLACVVGAIRVDPFRHRSLLGMRPSDGPRVRLMTWNIGYAGVEGDNRAHDSDMRTVAQAILRCDPEAVALQELAGPDQLRQLLNYLRGRYNGAISQFGSSDRIEAVLVKDRDAQFEDIVAGDKYSLAAMFKINSGDAATHDAATHEVVLVSAHADAFNSARRRLFTGDVMDWAEARPESEVVFVAGDFNFELNAEKQSNLFTDNAKNDSESYSYILKYFRDLGRDAGWTAINNRRIDYIFGPPEAALLRRAEVIKDAGAAGMDHCPLVVEVAL
jgi:endonuclease/exonuclease/phosphatase family metal-dependent hydrolase